ncbi:TetR/AcrR family transcriptional regulator [Rothia uropygialis]|uniref:TetR/AcrR family transcriptional regulator n=1 Tax=Kocuria sp. 36 TaxID=1415402 RepID=UPI00101BCD07|nr:TetR/AcrR family transcriptional regulator [Kocuria sp. 36]
MPKLSESSKIDRRERIIAAARRCFLSNGFSNTSMADIVAESGMSPGSIYSHFDGKASIMRGTAESIFHAALQDLVAMESEKGSTPAPSDVARLVVNTLFTNGLGPLLIQFIAESTVNPEVGEVARENIARARQLLTEILTPWSRQRVSEGADPLSPLIDPPRLANMLLLFVHGLLVRTAVDVDADLDRLVEDAIRLFPDGENAA